MNDEHRQDVGSSLPVPAVVAAVVAVVVIVAGVAAYLALSGIESEREIVIATGSESGMYHELGGALARVLEAEGVVKKATARPTDGSVANMQLIAGGDADLAFVQSDTRPAVNARLMTPLYDEIMHIFVSQRESGEIVDIHDLGGRKVAVGMPGSGTRQLAERILRHFGVELGEKAEVAADVAARMLIDGEVDAAFILTAIPSPLIDTLVATDKVRFLSLGDAQEYGNEADGLELTFPSMSAITIPRSTYSRLPLEPVQTVAVSALLVARDNLDDDLVRDVTAAIFEHRGGAGGLEGDARAVAQRIREDYRPRAYAIPLHDGAEDYYNREDPPFFVEYAEAISLGLTLLVGAYSGYIALREWIKRRMKNRIDAYLIEVEELSTDLQALSLEELVRHRDALDGIRNRAFSDLVSERLLADQSFTIFQNHLRDEFAAVEARINEKKSSG